MVTKSIDWTRLIPILISVAALFISIISLFWRMIIERRRRRAKLEVWQRHTFYVGGDDERTTIHLLFRNISHRPTAIIDIYVRDNEGGIFGGSGYRDRINLPIRIKSWDVRRVDFRIEKDDEEKMKDILISDIDGHEIVVDRSRGEKWVKIK